MKLIRSGKVTGGKKAQIIEGHSRYVIMSIKGLKMKKTQDR
jgi:hypothetical protein